jgi:IS6 family transposase
MAVTGAVQDLLLCGLPSPLDRWDRHSVLSPSFPPTVIGLAVRWYLRFRLRYAEVVEGLAERHIQVDASTVFDGVQKFAPLYQGAAKAHRHRVGSRWSVDKTYVKVTGR